MKLDGLRRKRKKTEHRFSLTLLLAFIVFIVLVVALSLAALFVYLFMKWGIIDTINGKVDFGNLLLFISVISLVIGAGITVLLGKFPLKPINKLVSGMNSLADGEFETRLEYGKPIEKYPVFVEITESFNKMAEQLGNTEMLRGDFINNFSHEFKTPIVSIAGFAEILESTELTEEERAQYVGAIKEESKRLASMATNILELTKVENQSILTDVSRFNVSEQLRSALVLLEGKWSKKKIELDFDFDEYDIVGNEELLKQVWINLLDNAIKFVDEGGVIGAKITTLEGQLRTDISNTGTTIPAEQQKYVFNKFYQADESHSTKGNGIGLAIVKRIVALHDGSVSVKSEDGVTTFSVYLPLKNH
ncbi:MAG: HAMP domain-containing histidine kinase [Ruminococcaceae bacterium]|nr:HAMP domain-containing histidine kinase [Oscillospiraceae bacterium]